MKTILKIKEIQVLSKNEQRNILGGGFGPCSQTSDCGPANCWACAVFNNGNGWCLLFNGCNY
ncbi:hypothetical protein [Kordia sp.]|uniref:hypothetical protein n=1 Tax=Kordia sp. TaxID=1965332 RepID=UPI003D6B6C23